MGIVDNLLNLNIKKLILKGDIAKAYEKMYHVAERFAVHEMKQRMESILNKAGKKFMADPSNIWVYTEEMTAYKEKRIKYHMNEMKGILKLREDIKE